MTTYFEWDTVEDNIVEEFDDAGGTIAEYTTEPSLYGDLVSQRRNGQSRFFHFDGLGSTTELTDSSGNVSANLRYSAFGENIEQTGSTDVPFLYVGQKGYYRDEAVIDYYVRRRSYRSILCRWFTPDPLGLNEWVNLYSYVRNRPISVIDPSGLGEIPPGYVEWCKCLSTVADLLNNPAFQDLLKCAVNSGCIRPAPWRAVDCTTCKENAAYVHGTIFGSHIEVCTDNWNALTSQEQTLVLYEELYHAITICGDFNRPHYSPALQTLVRAYHQAAANGRYPAGGNIKCFMCYGKEYLAKACARRSANVGLPVWGGIHGEVSASCEPPCRSGDFLPGTIENQIVGAWYNANALNACFNIDNNCILTGKR